MSAQIIQFPVQAKKRKIIEPNARPRYIRTVDVAKLLRKKLKDAFPSVKFSVKSDGTSIDVRWTDGPASKAVDMICDGYAGGGFDGMIDLAFSYDTWLLPDGLTCITAGTKGTEGSGGVYQAWHSDPPEPGSELVSLQNKFVFAHRSYTTKFTVAAWNAFVKEHPIASNALSIRFDEDGGFHVSGNWSDEKEFFQFRNRAFYCGDGSIGLLAA